LIHFYKRICEISERESIYREEIVLLAAFPRTNC